MYDSDPYPTKTTILVGLAEPGGAGGSIKLELADEFDETLDKVYALQPPLNSEAERLRWIHTLTNGNRVMLHPSTVGMIIEGELPVYGL